MGVPTDVGEGVDLSAGAIVLEAREVVTANQLEVAPDHVLASTVVGTKPGGVSGGATQDPRNVQEGVPDIELGVSDSGVKQQLLVGRTAVKASPLVVDTRGSLREATRELHLSGIPNSGVEVLGGTISIDVGEKVRWFDGVLSSARLGEVIRSGHWRSFHEMTSESKVVEMNHLRS